MFNNRALSIQIVRKPAASNPEPAQHKCVDIDEITQIAMYHAEHAAKIIGALYVGHKLLNTACEIAVIAAKSKL